MASEFDLRVADRRRDIVGPTDVAVDTFDVVWHPAIGDDAADLLADARSAGRPGRRATG